MKYLTNIATVALFVSTNALAALPATAQDQGISLSGDVMLEKVTIDDGGETSVELVEPATIVPGDKLIFGTDYSNRSSETVQNFVVTNPVPAAVRLAPDADPDLTVSVDGGETWGAITNLTVADAEGTVRPANHADVTHIRWTLASVAPGQDGRLEYPAIIR